MARAKETGPQFVTSLERFLERGYTSPPLAPEQVAYAVEQRARLARQYGQTYDVLSDGEIWALRQYTTDSFPTNAFLRELLDRLDDEGKRDLLSVQSAIGKLGDGVERVTFRGARSDPQWDRTAARVFIEGKVVQSQSFISTSSSEFVAQEFGDRYFFTIKGRSAANVDGFYTTEGENEFLFPAGASFRVARVTDHGGIIHVELEETSATPDFLFSVN